MNKIPQYEKYYQDMKKNLKLFHLNLECK